ncbi:MAG: diphosphate--fructose-6-phosphate 1-phosphotransferase [Bryobacterales bacterium]|nr:diphosphate--fructose-6-phosphate 1-phosphotransferase [Bryobacterales bacterium]
MVTLQLSPGEQYGISTGLTPLNRVAYLERLLADVWRHAGASAPLPGFREYAEPLTGPIAKHPRLKFG